MIEVGFMSKKILHLFQWKLTDIITVLPKVKEQGFDAIQVSPLQGTKDAGYEWWKLYQPTNFKIGNSQVGSRDDLIKLCGKAHDLGIEVYVDVVLRHVAGDDYHHLVPHDTVDADIKPEYYYCFDECNDYNNRYEYTHKCTGMPMLNYFSHAVQDMYISYLDDLVSCGVDGFRLDQLKHYALPVEGCDFLLRVFGKYTDKYIYGEIIFSDKGLLNEYSKYINVLTEGSCDNKDKLVTFVESHDSYLEFGYTKNMSNEMLLSEYDHLVNECDFNTLFYARPFNNLWLSSEVKEINLKGCI